MSDFVETPLVDAVLSLDAVKDEQGADFALLTIRLENGRTVRLPMPELVAMRVWALFDKLRQDRGWSAPATPVSTDKLQ